MFKKSVAFILMFCVIFSGFGTVFITANAGTDPEPVTIYATDDAEIVSKKDTNYNFGYPKPEDGEASVFHMKSDYQNTSTATYQIPYFKFDISEIDDATTINEAVFRLYLKPGRNNAADYVRIYAIENTTWTEDTLTFTNAPVTTLTNLDQAELVANVSIRDEILGSSTAPVGVWKSHDFDIKDYLLEQLTEEKEKITFIIIGSIVYQDMQIQGRDLVGTPGAIQSPNPPRLIINPDHQNPTPPENVNAAALSTTEISLTWDAATDNVAVAGYELYKNDEKVTTVAAGAYSSYSYVFENLLPSTEYSFHIKAVDSSQNVSSNSATVTGRTDDLPDNEPPSKPTDLTGQAMSDSKVMFSWTKSTDNIGVAGYNVYQDGLKIKTTSAEGNENFTVEGLSRNTAYIFEVEAFDIKGNISEMSDPITLTTKSEADTEPPSKPLNLTISDLTTYSSEATLTWDEADDNYETTGYVIYVNGHEKAWTDTNAYQFTDLAPNTTYIVTIKAVDDAGNISEVSDALDITTQYGNMIAVGPQETNTTITAALSTAHPGDVIIVKAGTYDAPTINKTGTAEKWITIMADPDMANGEKALLKGTMTLNGNYLRISGLEMEATVIVKGTETGIQVKGQHYQVANMVIKSYYRGVNFSETGSDLYFADNYLWGCGIAIITGGQNTVIEGNEIERLMMNERTGSGVDCDYIRVFGEGIIIRGNYCHGTLVEEIGAAHVDFVQSYDDNAQISRNVLVENNFVTDHTGQAIMVSNAKYGPGGTFHVRDWTIRNNIITGFRSWALSGGRTEAGIPNLNIENNIFIGNPEEKPYGVGLRGPGGYGIIRNNIIINAPMMSYGAQNGAVLREGTGHNLIYNALLPEELNETDIIGMDPLFVDDTNGNYNLLPNSPAIDNGAEATSGYDMDGKKRPYGKGWDIGPLEFHGIKANTPPTIIITTPQNGTGFIPDAPINVTVFTRDDEAVVKVEYFLDETKVGESTEAPFNCQITGIQKGIFNLYGIAYDAQGLSTRSSDLLIMCANPAPVLGNTNWTNISISEQIGIMETTFRAVPLDNQISGLMGITLGEADVFNDIAVIVRFNTSGKIDAFNSSKYAADQDISYVAGKEYIFKVYVDIPNRKYTATVTDEDEKTSVICSDYSFRAEMASSASLDHIVAYADVGKYALMEYSSRPVIMATEFEIVEKDVKMKVGDTQILTGTVLPENATSKELEWTSSNEAVATVNENGIVTAVAKGEATITATVIGTDLTDTCMVTVEPNQVGESDFTIEDVSIDKETGIAVKATVTSNTVGGGTAVVIFKLMKNDGTVIGLTSSELYIEDDSVFKVKFHGYSGDEYKVKIYVWDRLDSSTEDIGENLAEPVEIQ